jgi:hypothetical protein
VTQTGRLEPEATALPRSCGQAHLEPFGACAKGLEAVFLGRSLSGP